jgi:ferric-dicitrate binding protein FerR (iron transport regulator)
MKPNNNPVVIGKTYSVDRTVFSLITTNDTVTFHFSNGLTAKIGTNSNFSVNDFQQEILNTNSEPEKARVGANMLTTTLLTGEGFFVYDGGDSNSMCSVSTAFVDVELLKGKFYFSCNEKSVNIVVLEGSLRTHGEHNKTELVEAGLVVLANPVQYQSKLFDEKVVMATKKVKSAVATSLLTEINPLSDVARHWIFVTVGGNLFGVLID